MSVWEMVVWWCSVTERHHLIVVCCRRHTPVCQHVQWCGAGRCARENACAVLGCLAGEPPPRGAREWYPCTKVEGNGTEQYGADHNGNQCPLRGRSLWGGVHGARSHAQRNAYREGNKRQGGGGCGAVKAVGNGAKVGVVGGGVVGTPPGSTNVVNTGNRPSSNTRSSGRGAGGRTLVGGSWGRGEW